MTVWGAVCMGKQVMLALGARVYVVSNCYL